jgi:hypothetical protein
MKLVNYIPFAPDFILYEVCERCAVARCIIFKKQTNNLNILPRGN